ncbi:hypothetical protein, partial [Serratia grimesii]|uniref:hypothetical protein n=1 Tax=Serratia grimesii TaxID=82995 RepID=UPI002240C414
HVDEHTEHPEAEQYTGAQAENAFDGKMTQALSLLMASGGGILALACTKSNTLLWASFVTP